MYGFDTQAASFGGTNIDPTAWEDKKCPGESKFPAQVYYVFDLHITIGVLQAICRHV